MYSLQHHCGAVILVINLVFWYRTKLEKVHLILNDLYRGLKYFDDVKLTHGGDEEHVCLKQMKLSKIHDKPQILVYGRSDRFVLDLCLYIEVAKHLILVTYFCFILPQKGPVWFLLMLRTSSAQVCKTQVLRDITGEYLSLKSDSIFELQGFENKIDAQACNVSHVLYYIIRVVSQNFNIFCKNLRHYDKILLDHKEAN